MADPHDILQRYLMAERGIDGMGPQAGSGPGGAVPSQMLYDSQVGRAPVWTGNTSPSSKKSKFYAGDSRGPTMVETKYQKPEMSTVTEQLRDFWTWDEGKRQDFASKLVGAGILKDEQVSNDTLFAAWKSFVEESAMYQGAKVYKSPADVLAMRLRDAGGASARPKKHVSKHFNISSPGEARALLSETLADKLGRAPTAQEVARFTKSLTAEERANPEITTTIEDVAGNTNSTTSGGFSGAAASDMANQQALNSPDYATYQAATTYFNAMLSALGPVVNL